jgi:hypothetical protein
MQTRLAALQDDTPEQSTSAGSADNTAQNAGDGQENGKPAETGDLPTTDKPAEPVAPAPTPDTPARAPAPAPSPSDSEAEGGTTESRKQDAAAQSSSDIQKERERITKENQRKIDERNDKLKKARDKIRDLNYRFADWYYVISEDVYKKIHVGRSDIIKETEEAKKKGFGVDAFRNLEGQGLDRKTDGGGTSNDKTDADSNLDLDSGALDLSPPQ